MKTVAIIAARMGSTRLPGKVLRKLGGVYTVLHWVVDAARNSIADQVVVATTMEAIDDAIVEECNDINVDVFRGSEQNVLERFYDAACYYDAEVIVRLTGDCPLLDPTVISDVILLRERENLDYASNVDPATWPDGLDVECFTFSALEYAHINAERPSDRDCLTQYIQRNRHVFKCGNLTCPIPNLANERWVLDTQDDLLFCEEVAKSLIAHCGDKPASYHNVLEILAARPELRHLNKHWTRNERFFQQRSTDPLPERHFKNSNELYHRARKVQPYGASTYSKSVVAYGETAPLFLSHGDGGVCFDVDGNDYVDFVGGVGAVILGHRNPQVDTAIRHQLDQGIGFSLGTELEIKVCERLSLLPSGNNNVVLGKNGSDVTAAAVRIARTFTKKKYITVLADSYHGWHDWTVGDTGRGHGVPPPPWRLYTSFEHLEPVGLDITNDDIAAVIAEPDRYSRDELRELRAYCSAHGALLIFDEVFTGLRYPELLASRHHRVHPDLTCIGKSIANGMPLSALIGRRDILRRFAPSDLPNAFYSTTHGGEALSLAACLATLDQMVGYMHWSKLQETAVAVEQIFRKFHVNSIGDIQGSGAPLNRITFKNNELANQFRCEMAHHGVLVYSSFNCMVAHTSDDLTRLESALDATFKKMVNGTARSYSPIQSTIMRR